MLILFISVVVVVVVVVVNDVEPLLHLLDVLYNI